MQTRTKQRVPRRSTVRAHRMDAIAPTAAAQHAARAALYGLWNARLRTPRDLRHMRRRQALHATQPMAHLRTALRLLAADRTLRAKLPRNAVVWQRKMRRESAH